MKGSDMALLATLGIGGYYLISKGRDTQQVLPGAGGGSPISLDLSGLLGGLGGLGGGGGVAMPDLSGLPGMLQGIFDTANKQASGLLGGLGGLGGGGGVAIPDLSGLPGMLQGIFDTANKQAGGITDTAKAEAARLAADAAAAGGGAGVIPAAVDLLGGLGGGVHLGGKNADWQGIKERSTGDFLGVGLAYLARFVAPMTIKAVPRVAASIGGKAALVGTGIGVPLAIAWTGADVLTTVYELATGKDVPIVGFGELFHPTQKEAVVTQVNRESYESTNAHQIIGQPPGYDRNGNPPGWDTSVMNPKNHPYSQTLAHQNVGAQIPEKAIGIKEAVASPGLESPVPYSRFDASYLQADYNSDIALLNKNLTADQKKILGLQ